jgi:3-oxoadipate CoA-transferase alpha subunit
LTVVEERREAPLGDLDPETVVTPGIFVDRVVVTGGPEATVQS